MRGAVTTDVRGFRMSAVRNELLVPLSINHRGTVPGEGKRAWVSWLEAIIRVEGSDLIVKSGLRPRVRHRGVLKDLETDFCTPDIMMQVAKDILDPNQLDYFARHGSMNLGIGGGA